MIHFVPDSANEQVPAPYAEAIARVASLLAWHGVPLPLEQLHLKRELIEDYRDLLPATTPEEQRRIRGEQDIIVRYEPAQALETLPRLLAKADDRKRLLTLFDRLLADERFQSVKPTPAQLAMFDQINATLRAGQAASKRLAPVKSLRAS